MEQNFSGKTVEAAVEAACAELNLDQTQFSYEIVEYPNKGFLGIGNKNAVIKVTVKQADAKSMVEDYLTGMFDIMGMTDYTIDIEVDGENMNIQVNGDDASVFQRKQGGAVEALQFLLALYVNKDKEHHFKVALNINNFREKSQSKLAKVAEKAAKQVLKNRRKMTLHPMSAYQRRMIHSALQDMENITTYSIGEEPNRRVVISYTGPDAAEYKPRQSYGKKPYNGSRNNYNANKYSRPATTPKPFNTSDNGDEEDR